MRSSLSCVAVLLVLVGSLVAQAPTFDVASIRESPPTGSKSFIGPQPGGRWVATNLELDEILIYLYPQYSWYAVDFGGPDWTTRVAFDCTAFFTARARGDTPPPIPPPSAGRPSCGFSTPFEDGVIRVLGSGMTMGQIASFMEGFGTAPSDGPSSIAPASPAVTTSI